MGSFVLFYKTRNCLSATKTKQRKNCFDVLLIQVSFETNQLNLKQFFFAKCCVFCVHIRVFDCCSKDIWKPQVQPRNAEANDQIYGQKLLSTLQLN